MKPIYAIILLFATTAIYAQARNISGNWRTVDDESGKAVSIMTISEKKGRIFGKITELLNPHDRARNCQNCSGEDKNKPLLGLLVIKGMVREGSEYNGKILDPKHGRLYQCTITFENNDKLKVRGYIGISLIGRTQYWERVK